MNTVIIMGRLTANVELRQTQSGISACRFTVAVDRKFKNKQTGEKETDFITCQAWRQTAEFISKYFAKGSMIAITGSLRTGSYTDKNHSDVKHYTTDVMVDNVEFCGSKSDNNGSQSGGLTAQNLVQNAQSQGISTGFTDMNDFEEILSDGDTPF